MSEQFPPPLVPSELVYEDAYPATKNFLRQQVDMQIADLRLLFRLPVDGLDPNVGCNFTVAAMMLNVISGFSVWFFQTDEAAAIRSLEERDGKRRSRKGFLGFVTTYWPQVEPEPSSDVVASRLYELRNSLSHDLGVHDDPVQELPHAVKLAKRPWALDDIVTGLERNLAHPLTVPVIEEEAATYTVHLAGVYWALHRMLQAALNDRPKEIESAVGGVKWPEIEELADSRSGSAPG